MRISKKVEPRSPFALQRRAWLSAPLVLVVAMVAMGCSGSKARESGFDELRPDAQYPSVSYLAGPGSGATDVRIDLDTGDIRVGMGPINSQRVRRDTLQSNELTRGRELFEASQVTHYKGLSGGSGSPITTGAAGEASAAPVGTSGGATTSIDDNAPPANGERASDDTQIVVTFPRGEGDKVFLLYPPTGVADQLVTDMLVFLADLAARYAP